MTDDAASICTAKSCGRRSNVSSRVRATAMQAPLRLLLRGSLKFCNAPMTWNGNRPLAVCVLETGPYRSGEYKLADERHDREPFRKFRMLNSEGRSGSRSGDDHAPSFNT